VALGLSSTALDHLKSEHLLQRNILPVTIVSRHYDVLSLLASLHKQFNFPVSFIRNLLLDGLRSSLHECARFCFVALEWWPLIRGHRWHTLHPDGRYHFRIELLLVDPNCEVPDEVAVALDGALPLLHFDVLTTLQLMHVPNQAGVEWNGYRWYVAGEMQFCRRRLADYGTGQLVVEEDTDEEEEEEDSDDHPYLPLPPTSLQRVSGHNGAAEASSLQRYTPPWEFIHLQQVPALELAPGGPAPEEGQLPLSHTEMFAISLQYARRGVPKQVIEKLLTNSARELFLAKMEKDGVSDERKEALWSAKLRFESLSVVDVRVRYLPLVARRHGCALIVAHGDSARSPNFFGASGINIAVGGLEDIEQATSAWLAGHVQRAVDILQAMGQRLNAQATEDHTKVSML